MATTRWYLANTVTDGWQTLTTTAQTAATLTAGWVVGTGSTFSSEHNSGASTDRASTTFTANTVPDATLDTSLKDAFRSAFPLNGSFAAANWTFQFTVQGTIQTGAAGGQIVIRILKADLDGSNATQITSAQQTSASMLSIGTSDVNGALTLNPGAFTVTNQYLFIQVAWKRTVAGGMTTTNVRLRTGSAATPVGTSILSSDFTNATVLAPNIAATSVLNVPTVAIPLDVTVDASVSTAAARGARALVFPTQLVGYCFTLDSTGVFGYVKTTDGGATWGSQIAVDGAAATTVVAFDIWFDGWTPGDQGTLIHCWWFDTTNNVVRWRTLNITGDALGTVRTVFTGASAVAGRGAFVSGTKTRSGYLYCAYDLDAGAERGLHRSTDSGTTWSTNLATTFIEATLDTCKLFPASGTGDNNDCWALYYDASALALTLKLWDSSAVAQVESATIGVAHTDGPTDLTGQFGYDGAVRHTDGHLIVAALSGRDVAASQHQVFDIASTSSITTLTAIAASTDDHYYPQVFINQGTGTIFVAYNGKRDGSEALDTTTSVYYTYSQNAGVTWDVGDNVYMQDAAGPVQQVWTPCSGARFYVIWRVGTKLLGNKTNSLIQLGAQLPTIDPTTVVNEPTVVPGAVAVTNGTISVAASATAPTVAQESLGATIGTTLGLFAPTLAYNPQTPLWNFDGSPLTVLYALTVAGGSVTWSGVIVQKKFATAQTASVAATFDNPVAGGNTIIALTSSFSGAATTFVVTDNRASVYQVAAFAGTPNDPAVGASYAPAVAGGTTTVTAAVGTTANWQVTLHIFEVQGVLTLEGTPLIVLGTAAAMSAGNATPAGQALLFSYFSKKNALSIAPGSGWTEQGELGDGSLYLSTSNTRFVATGGSYVADAGGGVDGQPYRAMALWFTGTMTIPDKAVSGGTIAGTSQVFAPLGVFFPKPYALLAHIGATPGPDGGTTSAINSTGASLLLVHLAWYPGAGGTAEPFVSDSFGNTWIKLTKRVQTGAVASMFLYAEAPASKVGSGHTVTAAATGVYPAISFSVWEGAPPNPVVMQDGEAGQGTTTSSTAVPVENGSLIVSGYGLAGGGGTANNGAGLAEIDEFPFNGSVNDAGGVGWLVQATAAPLTIVWTMSGSAYRTSSSVVFKPSALPPQAVTGNRIFPTRVLYAPVTVVGGVITPPGTIVQSKMATASGVNEVYVILDTPVRQGNTLIGFLFSPDTVLITNTAEIDSEYRTFNGYYRTPSTAPSVLIAYNPGAEGNQVEMYGWMFGATKITMVIVEVQGLFVPDVAGIQNSGTTAAMSAGTLTPPGAALLFGLLAKQGSSNNAPGAGWTELQDLSDGTYQISVEKQTVATGGAVAVTGSGGSDGAAYTAFGASFRDVTGSILLPYLFPTSFTRALAQVGNPLYTASTYATLHLPFDEASGVRMSTRGPQPFLEVAGPTGSAAGQFGQGANFVASNFRILSAAHDTAFQPAAGVDFTLRCWVKLNSIGATQGIVVKRNWNAPYECTFELYYYAAGNRFEWVIGNSSGTVTGTYADRPVVAGTWYLVHACYDHTLQRVVLSVNGVYWGFNNIPAGYVPNWAGSLDIGGYNIGYFDGVIDDLVLMPGFYMPYELRSFDYSSNLPFLDWNGTGGSRAVTTPDRATWFTPTTTVFAPTVARVGILTGLVAYYPLDEPSGDALDVFAGKTLWDTGTIGTATGKVGAARDFEADVLDCFIRGVTDPAFNLPGDFTIAVWLKPETVIAGGVAEYLGGGTVGNWAFATNADGSIWFARKEAGGTFKQTTGAGLLTAGTWRYVVVRFTAGTYTIWVDGVSRSLTTGATTLPSGGEMALGIVSGVGSYDGLGDEFVLWNVAKTDADLAYLYNGGNGRSWADLNPQAIPGATIASTALLRVPHVYPGAPAAGGWNPIPLVQFAFGGFAGANGGVTSVIDTRFCNLLVAHVAWSTSGTFDAPPTVSDNQGNTWVQAALAQETTVMRSGIFYCANPVTSALHTLSVIDGGSNNSYYPSVQLTGWVGSEVDANVLDLAGTASHSPSAATRSVGPIYPASPKTLIITGCAHGDNSVVPLTIDSSFVVQAEWPWYSASLGRGGVVASLVQSATASVTPTWSLTNATAVASTIVAFKTVPIRNGLLAYYAFDESSGNALDTLGAKPLTEIVTVGAMTGKIAGARDFEADNFARFQRTDAAFGFPSGDFTIAVWVKVESLTSERGIAGYHQFASDSQGDWQLKVDVNGSVVFAHIPTGTTYVVTKTFTGQVSVAFWAFVAVRYAAGTYTVWVDGSVFPMTPPAADFTGAATSFVVGSSASGKWYDGGLDELVIWNTAKSDADIIWLYNISSGRAYTDWPQAPFISGATVASTSALFAPTLTWTQLLTTSAIASASQVFIPAVAQPGPATAIVCSTRTIRVTRRDIFRSRILVLRRHRVATPPAVVGDQSVTATTLASGVQLFAATVAPGPITITGATRVTTLAVTAPTPITTGPVTVTGGTQATTLALNAPTITVGPVTVLATSLAPAVQLFAPTLLPQPVTVVGGTRATAFAVFAPALAAVALGATILSGSGLFPPSVTQNISIGTVAPASQLFIPTVVRPAVQAVTGGTIAVGSALTAPTLAPGPVTVTAPTVASTFQIFVPIVSLAGVVNVGGEVITTTANLFGPTLLPQPVTVVNGTLATTLAIFAPSLSAASTGATIVSGSGLFAPALAYAVTSGTRPTAFVVNAPSLAVGAVTVTGATLAAASQVFAPSVGIGAVTVGGAALPSSLQLFAPSLAGAVTTGTRTTTLALFAPSLAGTLTTATIPATTVLYPPTALATGVLSSGHVASTLQLFALTVTPGAITITGPFTGSVAHVDPPSLAGTVVLGTRGTTVVLNAPSLTVGAITFVAGTVPSATQLFGPLVGVGATAISGALIGSTAQLFVPAMIYRLDGPFIPSTAVLFPPTLLVHQALAAGTILSGSTLAPPALLPISSVSGGTIPSAAVTFAPAIPSLVRAPFLGSTAVLFGPSAEPVVGVIVVGGLPSTLNLFGPSIGKVLVDMPPEVHTFGVAIVTWAETEVAVATAVSGTVAIVSEITIHTATVGVVRAATASVAIVTEIRATTDVRAMAVVER